MKKFKHWWWNTGSGIMPLKNEDQETHTKRVCEKFYRHLCEITPGLDICVHPYTRVKKSESRADLNHCTICGGSLI